MVKVDTVSIAEVHCHWSLLALNFGHREVQIVLGNKGYAEKCQMYAPAILASTVLEELPNPTTPKAILAKIYKHYAFPDLTAIRIRGQGEDPLSKGVFPWISKFIELVRENEEEDIAIIIETLGNDGAQFNRIADFLMENEVGILIKTTIPSTIDLSSGMYKQVDRQFESAAVCLSTVVGNAMGGAWLAEYALQIDITPESDVKSLEQYLDVIHSQFAGAGIANDLVRIVVHELSSEIWGGENLYDAVSNACSLVADRFGASSVTVLLDYPVKPRP